MLGDGANCRGLIGGSIDKLFDTKREIELSSEGRSSVSFSVEMLEIYNEQVRDPLAPCDAKTNANSNGKLLKVTSKEVEGKKTLLVEKKEDIMQVLSQAQKRRCVKATKSNEQSSRSHLLITLNIVVSLENGTKRIGKLNICDLAGNERLNKSGTNHVGVRTD